MEIDDTFGMLNIVGDKESKSPNRLPQAINSRKKQTISLVQK